jgi:hypothetical protein
MFYKSPRLANKKSQQVENFLKVIDIEQATGLSIINNIEHVTPYASVIEHWC